MRILILGINDAPEIISTAVYSTGLAEYLANEGHEVDVDTALPHYPAWRVFDGWRDFRWRRETPKPLLPVTHCPLYVPATPPRAGTLGHGRKPAKLAGRVLGNGPTELDA